MNTIGKWLGVLAAVIAGFLGAGVDLIERRPATDDHGQTTNSLVWIVVGILAAIALLIFIVTHVQTKP